MAERLERRITELLDAGTRFVSLPPDGRFLPWEASCDPDLLRARGYELLDLHTLETQVRVVQFFLDRWVAEARTEGQRMIAALLSPLPGRGGSA